MADDVTDSGLPTRLDEEGFPQPESWLSLLQFFVKEEDAKGFEEICDEMYEQAKKQPGYKWAHYGRSLIDGRYFIVSEWESRKAMKEWEDHEAHSLAMDKGEPMYHAGRDMQNRKFIPWYKPGAERKPWTP
jgi:heme-degrading monooxygenase HmoA